MPLAKLDDVLTMYQIIHPLEEIMGETMEERLPVGIMPDVFFAPINQTPAKHLV
jgi:hypothetical protein